MTSHNSVSCYVQYMLCNNSLWQLKDRMNTSHRLKATEVGVAGGRAGGEGWTEITAWLPACPSK